MGRELKRVALDFDHPLNERWTGFVNRHDDSRECPFCAGSGLSAFAKDLHDQWYGKTPFDPSETGSTPFDFTDPRILEHIRAKVDRSREHYGHGEAAVLRESRRMCGYYNAGWCYHLEEADVQALVDSGRKGLLSPREMGYWAMVGMGHDSINCFVCVEAKAARAGQPHFCDHCNGDGEIWRSPEAKARAEAWEPTDPPAGEGWQMWETVSEGSPISPVFATPEELAHYLAGRPWGADYGSSYDSWLRMILSDGWAPSFGGVGGALKSGVELVHGVEPC